MTTPQLTEKDLEIVENIFTHDFLECESLDDIRLKIYELLAAQRLETLKSDEVNSLVSLLSEGKDPSGHTEHPYCFDCRRVKALEKFNALISSLEPKEDKSK